MPSRRLPVVAALLLLTVVLLFGAFSQASAQGMMDAYTVRGVDVDVTAANPNAAKDEAIAEGQRIAFRQLLERLTQPSDHARLPKAEAADFVRDFSIDQERRSAVRYIATLTVRFNPNAVRKLLRTSGIAFTDARAKPVVIIPVLETQGRTVLWDEPNPWRTAWNNAGGGGLVPFVVPPGDVSDTQAVSPAQAISGDAQALAAEGARFRTTDVIVAAGALSADGRRLDVKLGGLPGTLRPFDTVAYDLKAGESSDDMLKRAATDVARAIEAAHKQANALQYDRSGSLSAIAPLNGLNDWLQLRQKLAQVPQVKGYDIVSLSKSEAALVLHILGDQEKVKVAMASAGLNLDWAPDGYWTLKQADRR